MLLSTPIQILAIMKFAIATGEIEKLFDLDEGYPGDSMRVENMPVVSGMGKFEYMRNTA